MTRKWWKSIVKGENTSGNEDNEGQSETVTPFTEEPAARSGDLEREPNLRADASGRSVIKLKNENISVEETSGADLENSSPSLEPTESLEPTGKVTSIVKGVDNVSSATAPLVSGDTTDETKTQGSRQRQSSAAADSSSSRDQRGNPRQNRGGRQLRSSSARNEYPEGKQRGAWGKGAQSSASSAKVDLPAEPQNSENEEEDDSLLASEGTGFEDLDTVYDLDRGNPFRGSETGESADNGPWNNKIESPKEFFNAEILYRFDLLTPSQREELAGSYRIELRGYKGGVWTVFLGEQLEVLNRREEADVVLSMKQPHFLQIVNGEMNPQLAILAKKVRLSGNTRRALAFHGLLAPVRD